MVNPQFIEERQVSMSEAKELLLEIEKKNAPLNYLSNKTKEYLEQFAAFPENKRQELRKKVEELGIVRLKPEHITKMIDFLPQTVDELKIILQAYPLSLSKKDQESIVAAVKACV